MSIILENVSKRFGSHLIVDRLSLEIEDGELFVLIGASGSGKSTVLRLIAGLSLPDGGRITLHGQDVTYLPPQQRGTGFVFQNYAIFRHMTVAQNIEFGLMIRQQPAAMRAARRDELLELVGLAGLGERFPNQLSGGQRQRVALARALAYEPNVLLLDEPFGALDVKIRTQLRRNLKLIQERLRVTTILVTHDQEEAFELADRIGVIERGHLLEVGSPEVLYQRPRSLFVASFLGAGTILAGRTASGQANLGPLRLPIPPEVPHEEGARVRILFRPEQVRLSERKPTDGAPVLGQGTLVEQSFVGAQRRLRLRLSRLPGTRQVVPPLPFGEEDFLVEALLPAEQTLPSATPWLSLQGYHVLDAPHPHLLLYTDGPEIGDLLRMAQGLAGPLRASLSILVVTEQGEQGQALLPDLYHAQQEVGAPQSEIRLRQGDPLEQIALEQSEASALMLLLARPQQGGDALYPLLTDPDLPVLVVPPAPRPVGRILICTAAGEPGKSDVRVGGWLARQLKASVTLLYVTPPAGQPSPLASVHLERAAATLRALDIPGELRTRAAATPAEGILAVSQEGAYDLIVVGGHGPRVRSILGRDDVTLQVIMGAPCPVLVVPAHDS